MGVDTEMTCYVQQHSLQQASTPQHRQNITIQSSFDPSVDQMFDQMFDHV
jgi:hypothetical protein